MMVWDQDRSSQSREIITALENTGTFTLESYVYDMSSYRRAMERGDITAAIIIPPDFSEDNG